ncbi:MAG: aryl-sulfate sulfotransferase [Flavobacteriaceae bacterium]
MNTLRLYLAYSYLFLFFSCVENEIETFDVAIDIQPHGSATIAPEVYGPLFPGDSIAITITPHEGYQFDQWSGTVSSFESTITLFGTKNHRLTASLVETPELNDQVLVYNGPRIDPNPIFAVRLGANSSVVLNKQGKIVTEYQFENRLGNDVEMLPNGEFLEIFKTEDRKDFSFGGSGGILKWVTADQQTLWEYTIASDTELAHHDVELLPNGNILTLVWEKISKEQAQELGAQTQGPIYTEKLVEINPNTDQIVWQWRSVEHLVQDVDKSASTYGDIREYPRKIDINYNLDDDTGDRMHANGIVYDQSRDLIFISVNFYDEVWVIDHSTTTAQASTPLGGDYAVGGDLVYRFGNPATYGSDTPPIFDRVHHPNFSNDSHTQMLFFSNGGTHDEQSTVLELKLPFQLVLDPEHEYLPTEVWRFTDPELFNRIVSGAVKLPNGNVLICEGDFGFWEVTPAGQVVWKMQGYQSGFWPAYLSKP